MAPLVNLLGDAQPSHFTINYQHMKAHPKSFLQILKKKKYNNL